MMRRLPLALALLLALPAWADAPELSPRPPARPAPAEIAGSAAGGALSAATVTGGIAYVATEAAAVAAPGLARGLGPGPATGPAPGPAVVARAAAGSTAAAAAGDVAPWRTLRRPTMRETVSTMSGASIAAARARSAALTARLALLRPRPRTPPDEAGPALMRAAPPARPATLVRAVNPARSVRVVQAVSGLAILRSPRPAARPENLQRRSVVLASGLVPTQPDPRAIIGRRGSVCGDPAIRGETIAPIAGRISGCGIAEPVRITEVDGVRLSTAATVDCPTALALRGWVSETVKPSVGRLGGGVAGLEVFAHYACRTRNNQRGARVSEHGRGRAIDIGAVVLANGAQVSVLDHWRDADLGGLLRDLHRGACGRFGTVLGPDADRFHQNHFHFDTAGYRSGAYCR